jgi:hypothetical protein
MTEDIGQVAGRYANTPADGEDYPLGNGEDYPLGNGEDYLLGKSLQGIASLSGIGDSCA